MKRDSNSPQILGSVLELTLGCLCPLGWAERGVHLLLQIIQLWVWGGNILKSSVGKKWVCGR